MAPRSRPGKIVTFYSYKGGTGRSMALANVAWILASNGYQVLAVDWDLEAPGLHRYFHPFLLDPELADTPGVLDMVWDVATAAMDPAVPERADWHQPYADVLNYAVSLRRKFLGGGTLDLLPAGRQDPLYSTRVGAFDWTNFYDRLGGGAFLEAVRTSMRAEYDYVLIDSRTGLSDTSGICTVQLPDMLVIGFTFNTQSVSGAAAVAASVRRQRSDLRILPVPMRVEDGERPKLERGRDFARARFSDLPTGMDDLARTRYWGEVEIPYRTFYAYEEILAPIGDRPGITNSVLSACERLVSHLTEGVVSESAPLDETERRELLLQLERTSAETGADFLISHALEDRPWADWLRWQLLDRGYTVFDLSKLPPGFAWTEAIVTATATATTVLAVVSPAYLDHGSIGPIPAEVRGRLLPVLVADTDLPAPLQSKHLLDLVAVDEATALSRLAKALKNVPRRTTAATAGPPEPDAPRFPGALPTVWNVPARNTTFVGRAKLLAQLPKRMHGRPVALVGLGGIGKTATALEYVHRNAGDYDLVWWINAAQPAQGTDQLIELGRQLGLGAAVDRENAVHQVLGALRTRRSWLLVFDDAEDLAALLPLIAAVESGHILITSRNASWRRVADVVEVGVLARPESFELLRRQVPAVPVESADELAALLGDLPLALSTAAAFMATTGTPFAEYLKLFQTHQVELLSRADPDGASSVSAIVLLAVDRLRGESGTAAALLELVSLFGPAPVPLALFQPSTESTDDVLRRAVTNPVTFAEMIGAISTYSLADRVGDALQVHRLVQAVVRNSLPTDSRRRYSRQVEGLLGAAAPGEPKQPTTWATYAELLPHVAAVETCDDVRFRELLLDAGWYLYFRGDPVGCRQLALSAAERFTSALGDEADDTLSALHLAAIAAWELGNYAEAADLNSQLLRVRERLYGPEAPATLSSRSNLALSLAGLGDVNGALRVDEEVLATRARVLGPDHPDTLASLGNLALRLLQVGDVPRARAIAEEQIERNRLVLGENHPATLAGLNNLAVILGAAGDVARSVELHETVIDGRRRLLGPQHPDTLNSTYGLAVALVDLRGPGDTEAQSLAQEAAVGFAHLYGDDHPSAVRARQLAAGPDAVRGHGSPEAVPT